MALSHLPPGCPQLSEFRKLTILGAVQVRIVEGPHSAVRMASGLKLNQVPFEPADPFLLSRIQGRDPPVLRRPLGLSGVQCLETGGRQKVSEQERRKLAMLVLQRDRRSVQLDDGVDLIS